MLRPERMSRVSVTGSKKVMDDVVETVYDLNLLHVTEYDGSWDGFSPGDPEAGADAAAEKLVTVRALESILDVTEEDAGPGNRLVTDEALDEELEDIRQEVNALDDRRADVQDELRSVEDRIDAMEPFVDLGIDLELLRDYDTLAVQVSEGDADAIRGALDGSDIETWEVFSGEDTVAVFARTDAATLQDALVEANATALEVPEGEGSPGEYLSELEHRKQQLESKLTTVEDELEDLRLEVGGFLLAAEEKLTIEVDKREAPLTFATTANAFIAEGWIPSERYDEFESAVVAAVDDHVEVSELERASYDEHGHAQDHEDVSDEGAGGSESPGQPAAADGGEEVAADGGTVTMNDEGPPVVQDNPGAVKPFEELTEVINRPKYSEFDPTVFVFLTFPAFFGFMIGDLGYGLLYLALGFGMVKKFDSAAIQSLGGVMAWAGGFTVLFGILYGEIFGLHVLGEIVWGGNPPMHKGLQPAEVAYAQAWLVLSLILGMLHLTIGYVLGFIEELGHGLADAMMEKGSWILMMVGLWAFVFSTVAASMKPNFLFSVFGGEGLTNPATGEAMAAEAVAYGLGFTGLPEIAGWVGLAMFGVGFVLLAMGDIIEVVEFLDVMVNVLSYTRIAAVLLAKAGMAFVVNLLFFGAYSTHGEFHFMMGKTASDVAAEYGGEATVMFDGLIHMGAAGFAVGLLVLVIGHLLVLVLGITSAGLQAVRLEYVEFFGKFFEGGGKPYSPFGTERTYTSD
ncbi:V-type ATP synthase subunit I [Halobacteriales archaeon Cl-PHB]